MRHYYVQGQGVPYSKDREDEWFAAETDLGDFHKAVFINHDSEIILGHVIDDDRQDQGTSHLMSIVLPTTFDWIATEISEGRAFLSSGVGENVPVRVNGLITLWPIVEISLIFPYADQVKYRSNPANWDTQVQFSEVWKGEKLM